MRRTSKSLQTLGRFSLACSDCSVAGPASQASHALFLSALPERNITALTSDSIKVAVPKRNVYQESARVYKQGRKFLGFVLPAVLKPARTLWHEVIGFLFLSMAIIFVFSGFRAVREFDGSPGAILRLVMLAFCVCLLGGYGIASFRRARKISRS